MLKYHGQVTEMTMFLSIQTAVLMPSCCAYELAVIKFERFRVQPLKKTGMIHHA